MSPSDAAVHALADFAHRAGVHKGVIHHQRQLAALRLVDEAQRLVRGGGERLLHQHVLACRKASSASGKWLDTGVAITTASTSGA